jgi:hypothetical protein
MTVFGSRREITMKAGSVFMFLALMAVVGTASGSTLVDLVCHGEVIEVLSRDEENGALELVVCFFEVDKEASATEYFADSFMEYEGNSERTISLEGLSEEVMESMAEGSMISVNYWHASGIVGTEEGGWRAFSSSRWTYLGEVSPGDEPSLCPLSMI